MPISPNIKLPTIKALMRLYDTDKAKAKAMRAVMAAYPPAPAWDAHTMRALKVSSAMQILDAMYNTHGVEAFDLTTRRGQHYTIYYLNTGDSYGITILYVKPKNGYPRYEVGTWGDWAEKQRLDEEVN